MECSICHKDKNFLKFVGADNVCNKCIEKNTIFKEIRFSNEKRLMIALKKRKIRNFDDLCKLTEEEFDNILLTDPNIGTYKAKKIKDDKSEIPIV